MEHDRSTLQPSALTQGPNSPGAARVPGLLRLFDGTSAMAAALPFGGEALELGRGSAVLGQAQDPRMSRRHARVHFDGQRFWATDLGSQNGTFVDGEAVPSGASSEVRRVLRMGDSLFVPCADVSPLTACGVEVRDGFVRGPAMQRLLQEVVRAARSGASLHVHGESGAGKEGIARAFHGGAREGGPFVAVNCAAIPQGVAERLLFGAKRGAYSGADADAPGYLQAAEGGTLFLDEVVELDLQVQAKLLRVLETGEVLALGAAKPKAVSVRICSASNKDLRGQVAAGKLREDLYFRLARPELALPPLRQRPEEVPLLLEREVRQASPGLGLHVSLVEACLLRPWPGNVRELLTEARGAARAALLRGARRVDEQHLSPGAGTAFGPSALAPSERAAARAPSETKGLRSASKRPPATTPPAEAAPREAASRARPLDEAERERIEEALRQQGGNVAATARALGMHRTHLRRLIDRGQIAAPNEPEPDAT
ncbi:MAG: sigma 54-interacting transcriptional regulator [Polyangiaceae bacterium]|nr:sigma 54-interacting transcriptional regulator [Polyangiaceae bacterium]